MLEIFLGNIQIPKLCKKLKCHDFFQSAQKCLGIKKIKSNLFKMPKISEQRKYSQNAQFF
jgi:hypothetical protein